MTHRSDARLVFRIELSSILRVSASKTRVKDARQKTQVWHRTYRQVDNFLCNCSYKMIADSLCYLVCIPNALNNCHSVTSDWVIRNSHSLFDELNVSFQLLLMFLIVIIVNCVVILHLTDLFASVGNRSSLNIDFLQNERLDVSASDGDCLVSNIEVTNVWTKTWTHYVVRVIVENL